MSRGKRPVPYTMALSSHLDQFNNNGFQMALCGRERLLCTYYLQSAVKRRKKKSIWIVNDTAGEK